MSTLYTVGHSTRSLEELVELLQAPGVEALVDVRTVPRSRRHPQFERDALSRDLPARGIGYHHEKALGGFRRPRNDSPNRGWQHPAFRGYADHMESDEFALALSRLQAQAREQATCVMCAEAQWWRCHRRLIADALLVRGWSVLHLGLSARPAAHEQTPFAVHGPGHRLTYPPVQAELPLEEQGT
ncbi:MAG: DUF488 domain-containing protein [Solirubrobacterales bacterium]|nr:DUF488 domain-containing protein [Solirubrobacterales bacterium]MBV9716448.1 DUF488 domain-containing protein [Solirubrobacterales bacterium]